MIPPSLTIPIANVDLRMSAVMPFSAQPSIAQVIEYTATHYGVSVATIVGRKRTKSASFVRHVAMYMARRLTNASYPEIGAAFGDRDHTTVMSAVRRIAAILHDLRESTPTPKEAA